MKYSALCMLAALSLWHCLLHYPVIAQGDEQLPSVELPPLLDRVLRDYEAAWVAGDADGLASLFTEDGFVLSGGEPHTVGRAAIRERYANAGGELLLRAVAFEQSASIAYIIGAYSYSEGEDQGKFVLTLRKVNGRWLITSDQDNPIRQ